jgi:DNA replication protein DnaC
MLWQFDNSGLPKAKYAPIKLDATTYNLEAYTRLNEIKNNIVDFVNDGNSLYICSANPGTGKTSWAIKMLQNYFHYKAETNIWNLKGMFVSVPELLMQYKDFTNPLSKEYKAKLNDVDLLVLDDIGISGLSAYDYNTLFVLVDKRMLAEKTTIFTSNKTSHKTLADTVGERIASRVWYTSEIVEIKGGDMRG